MHQHPESLAPALSWHEARALPPEEKAERRYLAKLGWKQRNPDKVLEDRRRSTSSGQKRIWQKTYQQKNAERLAQRERERFLAKPEYIREIKRRSSRKCRAKLKLDPEAWDRYLLRAKECRRKRSEAKPKKVSPYPEEILREMGKIKKRVTQDLRRKLFSQRAQKSDKTVDYLGCSIPELMLYLQTKFKPGMSWDNYGKWEIDHILPAAGFNLTCPLQQDICFHYTNLQPLWMPENRSKGRKVLPSHSP